MGCLVSRRGGGRCKRGARALSLVNIAACAGANMDAASKDQNAPARAPI